MSLAEELDRMLITAKRRVAEMLNRVLLAIGRCRDRLVTTVGRLVEFIGYHLTIGRLRAAGNEGSPYATDASAETSRPTQANRRNSRAGQSGGHG